MEFSAVIKATLGRPGPKIAEHLVPDLTNFLKGEHKLQEFWASIGIWLLLLSSGLQIELVSSLNTTQSDKEMNLVVQLKALYTTNDVVVCRQSESLLVYDPFP